jgi:hypothetical protein
MKKSKIGQIVSSNDANEMIQALYALGGQGESFHIPNQQAPLEEGRYDLHGVKYTVREQDTAKPTHIIKIDATGKEEPFALDFMGTMNSPQTKKLILGSVCNLINSGNTQALEEAGFTDDQLKQFSNYLKMEGASVMGLREYVFNLAGAKESFARYISIGAEQGHLESCAVYDDVVDFLTLADITGHPVEIFSTLKTPSGLRSLQEIMLEKKELSLGYKLLTGAETAWDLVQEVVVNKLKKTEPGKAVLEEAREKNLGLYVDDEKTVIDEVINAFSNHYLHLPVLCRLERAGIKDPGYQASSLEGGIGKGVVANSLMDNELLSLSLKTR